MASEKPKKPRNPNSLASELLAGFGSGASGKREADRWDDPDITGKGDAEEDGDAEKEETVTDDLIDPGAGRTRKRQKKEPVGGGLADFLKRAAEPDNRLPDGTVVCLINLVKAPQLNGKIGTLEGGIDESTNRRKVLLDDNSVKSICVDNFKVVHTGAIVKLEGLQGAAELNGKLGECGNFFPDSGRYDVTLIGGILRRVKEENVKLVSRHVTMKQILSKQRCPFRWAGVLEKIKNAKNWQAQMQVLDDFQLPHPRFLGPEAMKKLASIEGQEEGAKFLAQSTVEAKSLPLDDQGKPKCRLIMVSMTRDVGCPMPATLARGLEDLQRLCELTQKLKANSDRDPYYLVPGACTWPMPTCLVAGAIGLPFYMQLCQEMVCLDNEHYKFKAWCRCDQVVAGKILNKPVYVLGEDGVTVDFAKSDLLLSDNEEETPIEPIANGQVSPNERQLMVEIAADLHKDSGFFVNIKRYIL